MPVCATCGEKLGPYAAMCHMCGTAVPGAAKPAPDVAEAASSLGRRCPACGQTYPADFADSFCACGTELTAAQTTASSEAGSGRPAAGTPCLVLYGPDKKPLGHFPIDKDALLIGRLDAVAGVFPDVDVTEFLDQAAAKKVSRQHALVLRSRVTKTFCLRPLAGNTGTQLEADMVEPLQDYPLKPGARMILGGAVRLKFEIA